MSEPVAGIPGLYVSAFFCQSTIREQETNILSAMRITDAYTVSPFSIDSKLVFFPIEPRLVVTFKSESPMSFRVDVVGKLPDGRDMPLHNAPNGKTGGGAAGYTLTVTVGIPTDIPGEFWFTVYVNDLPVTKVPFRVIHAAISTPQSENPSSVPVASE
jgi:hypothetical protein